MSKIEAGQVFATNDGGSVVVLEYRSCNEILVQHQDDHKHVSPTQASHLRRGMVKNPFRPSVFGVGYNGVGRFIPTTEGKQNHCRSTWKGILERGYCSKYQKKKPTYVGCSVDERWHNFQNFAEWYYEQPYRENDGFALDKDLIVWGNKVYSPEACSFVPREVNGLFCTGIMNDELPIGVMKSGKKFQARVSVYGESKFLGVFPTQEEAHEKYKKAKAEYVKDVAERYKDVLHPTVYKNLMEWELV